MTEEELEYKVQKIRTDAEEAVRKLRTEFRLLQLVEAAVGIHPPVHVMINPLYGTLGTLTFKGRQLSEVAGLIAKLPPLSAVQYHDGTFLSYRFLGGVSDQDRERRPNATVQDIAPITVEAQCVTRPEVTVLWYTQLEASVMRVRVELDFNDVFRLVQFRGEKRMSHGNVYLDNEGFSTSFTGYVTHWASGGPEYHKHRTIWWAYGTDVLVHFAELAKKLDTPAP